MAGTGPALTVKIGVDTRELDTGLSRAKNSALLASDAFRKAFEASQTTKAGQQALNKEINDSITGLRLLASVTDKHDKNAIAGLKELVAEQRDYLSAVNASAKQVLQLEAVSQKIDNMAVKTRTLSLVTDEHTGHVSRFEHTGVRAFENVLYAAGNLATGTETGMRQALTSVGTFALAFGEGGLVFTALLAGGDAIYNYFQKAREEMQKTREKFNEELNLLVNQGGKQGQLSIETKLRTVEQGTPAAHGSDGLTALSRRQVELFKQVSAEKPIVDRFGEIRKVATPAAEELAKVTAQIIELGTQAQNLKYALKFPPDYPNDITGLRDSVTAAKDPFSTKIAKGKKLPTYQPPPTLGDEVLKHANLPESVTDINAFIAKKEAAANKVDTQSAERNPGTLLQNVVKGMEDKVGRPMTALERTVARQTAASENLRNVMGQVGQQFLSAAQSFIAARIGGGAAGSFGAGVGGALGGAIGQKLGATAGGIIGSAVPVVGTIIGSIAGGLIGKGLGSLFGGHSKHVDANAAALDKASQAANKLAESLTNVPSGFKIALYGYRAQIPATPKRGPGGQDGDPGTGTGNTPSSPAPKRSTPGTSFSIQTLNVYANDPQELQRKMEQEAARGGSTLQPQYSSFRPIAVAV